MGEKISVGGGDCRPHGQNFCRAQPGRCGRQGVSSFSKSSPSMGSLHALTSDLDALQDHRCSLRGRVSRVATVEAQTGRRPRLDVVVHAFLGESHRFRVGMQV